MKRANLRAKLQEAGLEAEKIDDVVNYIMDENGKDVNAAKNTSEEEFAKVKAEKEALEKDKNELTTKLDGYKDYDLLKQFKAESDAKTQKQQRVDYLKSIGCKHPELFENQIDWSKASYDEDKKTFTGLYDTLKGFKESYKDMFEVKNPNPTPTPQPKVITIGGAGSEIQNKNQTGDLLGAINAHYSN